MHVGICRCFSENNHYNSLQKGKVKNPMPPQLLPCWRVIALMTMVSGTLPAVVTPNPLFSDGAVLQRGQPVSGLGHAREMERR